MLKFPLMRLQVGLQVAHSRIRTVTAIVDALVLSFVGLVTVIPLAVQTRPINLPLDTHHSLRVYPSHFAFQPGQPI